LRGAVSDSVQGPAGAAAGHIGSPAPRLRLAKTKTRFQGAPSTGVVIPAFAFVTFYSLIVILFASAYRLISAYTLGRHFNVGGTLRGLSFSESSYFSIGTISTVGYGDVIPTSNRQGACIPRGLLRHYALDIRCVRTAGVRERTPTRSEYQIRAQRVPGPQPLTAIAHLMSVKDISAKARDPSALNPGCLELRRSKPPTHRVGNMRPHSL
jgi:Ion channel